ncbi:MAG: hypothetical protein KJZ78_19525, partial [Bryobacteraceae bacterium]|nr:hypothetical protein [Bryobacteraceae bacterium]
TGKKKFALSDVQSREFRKSIAELSATAVTLSQLNGTVKEVVKRWLSAYAAIDPDGEGARFKDPTEPDYYGRLIGGWFLRNLLASVGKKPAPTDEFTPSLGWLRPLYQAVKDVCEVLADDDPRFQKLDLFSQTGFLDFARTLLIPGHDEVIRSVEADQKRRMAMCRLARDSWNLVLWYAHAAVSDRGICSNSADPSADLLEGELVIGLTSADAGILADLYAIAAADTNHVDIRGLCRRIGNEISAEDREEAS